MNGVPPPGVLRLASHPFFEGMKGDLPQTLAPLAVERTYAFGDMLIREGDIADRFVLIFEGKVALEIVLPDRPRVTIQTLGGGEVLGWSWLLPPPEWWLDARAVKRTRCLELPAAQLRTLLDARPEYGYQFLLRLLPVVAQRLDHTRMQLMDLHGR
ncbi:MAG TPA: cyclic nucleotide-binding domain-containing protein [Thermoplasmata archaeon]|nr:cyclic nucleotide-binding domain-containing protein [Thermoplasmata archaeon]